MLVGLLAALTTALLVSLVVAIIELTQLSGALLDVAERNQTTLSRMDSALETVQLQRQAENADVEAHMRQMAADAVACADRKGEQTIDEVQACMRDLLKRRTSP